MPGRCATCAASAARTCPPRSCSPRPARRDGRSPASSRRAAASRRSGTNYPFADTLSDAEQRDIRRRILSDPSEAVALGQESYADTVASLGAERSADIWGASKDVLLYVRRATLRVTATGYAILTRRRDVQRVISEFTGRYRSVVTEYRARACTP